MMSMLYLLVQKQLILQHWLPFCNSLELNRAMQNKYKGNKQKEVVI